MDFSLKIPYNITPIQQALGSKIDRPIQAWQWMVQTRSLPDQNDWVRPEVINAWQRCFIAPQKVKTGISTILIP